MCVGCVLLLTITQWAGGITQEQSSVNQRDHSFQDIAHKHDSVMVSGLELVSLPNCPNLQRKIDSTHYTGISTRIPQLRHVRMVLITLTLAYYKMRSPLLKNDISTDCTLGGNSHCSVKCLTSGKWLWKALEAGTFQNVFIDLQVELRSV